MSSNLMNGGRDINGMHIEYNPYTSHYINIERRYMDLL